MVSGGRSAARRRILRTCVFGQPLLLGGAPRRGDGPFTGLRGVADGPLALAATFVLLLGTGALPRNFALELLLLLVFGGWCVFWLVALLCEKAGGRRYLRLCHWALFLVLFGLVLGGMLG